MRLKKTYDTPKERAFVAHLHAADASSKTASPYDDSASERTLYNYFRDYSPAYGRYVESDPIWLRGGVNTYGYVRGNPESNADPLGLMECRWVGLVLICDNRPPVLDPRDPYPTSPPPFTSPKLLPDWLVDKIKDFCSAKEKPATSCQDHYQACLMTSLAGRPGSVFGESRCLSCRNACVAGNGIWPASISFTNGSVGCDYWNYQ